MRCGWGLERNRNGGSAAAAVLALPAVAGKFGVRGGGYAMSNSSAWAIDRRWIGEDEPDTRVVNMNLLGRMLTEEVTPPVKVLFVYNCNPVATVPNQNLILRGLAREDLFTVVFDQVTTDTAAYADVVLPATTFLETYDVARAYGPISLQLVQPVVDAAGESRSNPDVFGALLSALGLDAEGEARRANSRRCWHVLDNLPGTAGDDLRNQRRPAPPFGTAPVQFVDVFPRTPDQKVDLFPEALDSGSAVGLYRYIPETPAGEFPLALISPSSDRTINSTLGELPRKDVALVMHPLDARAREPGGGRTAFGCSTTWATSDAPSRSSPRCGRARWSCRKGSGARARTTARPPRPWRRTRCPTSAPAPVSTTPGSRWSGSSTEAVRNPATAPAAGSTSRPRPPRLTWPPLRPAVRASSDDHS